MNEYHKIKTVFKRDPATKYRTLLDEYATPEFEYLRNLEWAFTEKVDGTNIRVMFEPGGEHAPRVTLGGKTERAQIPATLVTHLQETFPADLMSHVFDGPTCLYGEGCGAKIQKGGGNYYADQRFVLFDVRIGDWWLKRKDVEDIARALGIPFAPVIGQGNLAAMVGLVKAGINSEWGDFRAEGIVARPMVELQNRSGKRIITKLKCKDFK
jgi:hypothetical protein